MRYPTAEELDPEFDASDLDDDVTVVEMLGQMELRRGDVVGDPDGEAGRVVDMADGDVSLTHPSGQPTDAPEDRWGLSVRHLYIEWRRGEKIPYEAVFLPATAEEDTVVPGDVTTVDECDL